MTSSVLSLLCTHSPHTNNLLNPISVVHMYMGLGLTTEAWKTKHSSWLPLALQLEVGPYELCPSHAGINLVLKVQRSKVLGSYCCQLKEPRITQEIDFWVCLWGIFKISWTGMGRLTLNVGNNIPWLHKNDFYISILLFPLTVGVLWPVTSCFCHLTDCTHKLLLRQPPPPLKLFNLRNLEVFVHNGGESN